MAQLKGQNFRILTYDSAASKFKCIGMATNCSITLGTNSDSASTKDDVGSAKKDEITSKNWQVSVESLDMQDIVAILTAMKSFQKFTLLWDEVSTADNQSPVGAGFARTGSAYLTDLSLTLNNRTNCSKSLQFTGTGQLAKVTTTPAYEVVTPTRAFTKGQYLRLFLGDDNTATPSKVIAFPTDLSFHVSISVESASTKDTTGDWEIQEPTELSFDISTNAKVRGADTITSSVGGQALADLQDIYEASNPVKFQIANVSGDNNRTKGPVLVEGSVILSQLQIDGQNRSDATYSATLNGWGEYLIGSGS